MKLSKIAATLLSFTVCLLFFSCNVYHVQRLVKKKSENAEKFLCKEAVKKKIAVVTDSSILFVSEPQCNGVPSVLEAKLDSIKPIRIKSTAKNTIRSYINSNRKKIKPKQMIFLFADSITTFQNKIEVPAAKINSAVDWKFDKGFWRIFLTSFLFFTLLFISSLFIDE